MEQFFYNGDLFTRNSFGKFMRKTRIDEFSIS
jgi:hypothetical protein